MSRFVGAVLPEVGQSIDEIDTPALLVDLPKLEANVSRMVDYMRAHGKDWRPHAKGNKSPTLAKRLIAAGAIGVTVGKLGEAEVMIAHGVGAMGGVGSILIANQIAINEHKLDRLARLVAQGASLVVTVDAREQVDAIARRLQRLQPPPPGKLQVIIEINIGMDRAGVSPATPPPDGDGAQAEAAVPAAVALARHVAAQPFAPA